MSPPRIVPIFLRHEYDAVLALGDLGLPSTYDIWFEYRAKEKAKHLAKGIVENETVIHPQKFAAYCLGCGQDASLTMLNAFAVAETQSHER